MNPALLKYYSQELAHLREMGAEFAQAFPKVAARLGLERFECADPYVERLLEGFSFLAARVQMRLDAQYPRFAQHLMEVLFPQYLAPIPSMVVAQFAPDFSHPSLARGVRVPRHTALVGQLDKHDTTRCEYRSAHELTLWPLELVHARYAPDSGAFGHVSGGRSPRPRAALHLRFQAHGVDAVSALPLDTLPIYLRGSDNAAVRIYEQLTGHVVGAYVVPVGSSVPCAVLPANCVVPTGLSDEQALLPNAPQSFSGFRLLQEYFAFAQRFLFVELQGLRQALRSCNGTAFELVLLLDAHDSTLESTIDTSQFALYCTPAVNLFERRTDRIWVTDEQFEYHVVADRTRPIDFEIHSIVGVDGYRMGAMEPRRFDPLYRVRGGEAGRDGAYYQVRRETRLPSEQERRLGTRSRYVGSEVYIALVDGAEQHLPIDLHQLGVNALCTNRDLPLRMRVGAGATDFVCGEPMPVESVRCIAGPSEPRGALAQNDDVVWRLVDGLSANYLSLTENLGFDDDRLAAQARARALRDLLSLHCRQDDDVAKRQIMSIERLSARPVTRRLPIAGPTAFGRGLEIAVEFADSPFAYEGGFLFGAVLQAFFAFYVSINHFTETVVRTAGRGEVMRWVPRVGQCAIL